MMSAYLNLDGLPLNGAPSMLPLDVSSPTQCLGMVFPPFLIDLSVSPRGLRPPAWASDAFPLRLRRLAGVWTAYCPAPLSAQDAPEEPVPTPRPRAIVTVISGSSVLQTEIHPRPRPISWDVTVSTVPATVLSAAATARGPVIAP